MNQLPRNQRLPDDLLDDEADVAAIYRADVDAQPPHAVDAAILAAAHKAVRAEPYPASPFSNRWAVPASLAAVLVLSVGLVINVYDEEGRSLVRRAEIPEARIESKAATDEVAVPKPDELLLQRIEGPAQVDVEVKLQSAPASPASLQEPPIRLERRALPAPALAKKLRVVPGRMAEEEVIAPATAQAKIAPTEAVDPVMLLQAILRAAAHGDIESAQTQLDNFRRSRPRYALDSWDERLRAAGLVPDQALD